jgi:hypothetical protein
MGRSAEVTGRRAAGRIAGQSGKPVYCLNGI